MDWNDLRYFLAVAREGSTLAAGRALRVSQTTVARRISALERALGFPLFEKRQAGYAPTPTGERLLRHAESVEQAIDQFAQAADIRSREISGTVTLTTHEIFTITLLAPILRELHELHPDIMINVDTREEMVDLGSGAAEVALRSTASPQPAGVVGRRLCTDDWTLYCSRDYAKKHGLPQSREELIDHTLIGGGGANLWRHYLAWLRELGLERNVAVHHASSLGLFAGVRAGFGIGVLPCVVADAEPDLIRCFPPREGHGRVLWLATHERVRHEPRVRVVADFLYDRLCRVIKDTGRRLAAA